MADEGSGVQNKKLLLVAVLLGVVVVIIYNVHIANVKKALIGPQNKVLRYKISMQPGDKISDGDLEEVDVPKNLNLDDVVTADSKGMLFESDGTGKRMLCRANKGEFVKYSNVIRPPDDSPAKTIEENMVALTLEVDKSSGPGSFLRAGNRVNLVGVFPFGNSAKSVRIIKNVVVIAVGGKSADETKVNSKTGVEMGVSSYRNITIMVPKSDSKDSSKDVAIQLRNVLTYAIGGISVEVCSPESNVGDSSTVVAINDELGDMRFKAKSGSSGSASTPPPANE